jgi:hypothetical protein
LVIGGLGGWAVCWEPGGQGEKTSATGVGAGVHLDFALRDRRNCQRDNSSLGHQKHSSKLVHTSRHLGLTDHATPLTPAEFFLREEKNKKAVRRNRRLLLRGEGEKL